MEISTQRRRLLWSDIKFLENVGTYNIPVNSILHLNVMYNLSNLELWFEDGSKVSIKV